jgi:hypothetical protein
MQDPYWTLENEESIGQMEFSTDQQEGGQSRVSDCGMKVVYFMFSFQTQ